MPTPRDDGERQCCEDVAREHCHVLCVGLADDPEPKFQYSIGLTHSLGHAEILLFFPRHETGVALINGARDLVLRGAKFADGDECRDLVQAFPVLFRSIDRGWYAEYLGLARWFYGGDGFEALQLVWPDKDGRFPTEPECRPDVRALQPQLWKPHH